MADDPDLHITKYGLKMYQHVIVVAPRTDEFGGDVKAKSKFFIEFKLLQYFLGQASVHLTLNLRPQVSHVL